MSDGEPGVIVAMGMESQDEHAQAPRRRLAHSLTEDGRQLRKTTCGKTVAFRDLEGRVNAACSMLVRKAGRLKGAERRCLRANLGCDRPRWASFWVAQTEDEAA